MTGASPVTTIDGQRPPSVGYEVGMTGASPVTTIHEPPRLLRSIVVRPLAGHACSLRVPCPVAGTLSGGQVIMPFDLVCKNLICTPKSPLPCASCFSCYTCWSQH